MYRISPESIWIGHAGEGHDFTPILDLGIEHNVVTKSGSFFSYGELRLGQGRNNAKAYLDEHVDVAKEIEAKVYDARGMDRDDAWSSFLYQ